MFARLVAFNRLLDSWGHRLVSPKWQRSHRAWLIIVLTCWSWAVLVGLICMLISAIRILDKAL